MKEHIDVRMNSVNIEVDGVEKRVEFLAYMVYALIALIVGAIAIPQLIVTWRSGRDRSLERQVETLTQEVETLKQQRIVNS